MENEKQEIIGLVERMALASLEQKTLQQQMNYYQEEIKNLSKILSNRSYTDTALNINYSTDKKSNAIFDIHIEFNLEKVATSMTESIEEIAADVEEQVMDDMTKKESYLSFIALLVNLYERGGSNRQGTKETINILLRRYSDLNDEDKNIKGDKGCRYWTNAALHSIMTSTGEKIIQEHVIPIDIIVEEILEFNISTVFMLRDYLDKNLIPCVVTATQDRKLSKKTMPSRIDKWSRYKEAGILEIREVDWDDVGEDGFPIRFTKFKIK